MFTQKQLRQNLFLHIATMTKRYKTKVETTNAQVKNKMIQKINSTTNNLVENLHVLCKDGRLVIPKRLQDIRTIAWYHHYLQHPGHTRLEET